MQCSYSSKVIDGLMTSGVIDGCLPLACHYID